LIQQPSIERLQTCLKDLFNKTIFQNDKERFGPNGPSLFDF